MLGQFYENVLSFADDCVLPLLTRVAVELNPDGSGPARREEMPFSSDYFPVELSPIRVEVSCAISPSRPDLPPRELCVYLEPVAESRANIRCVLRRAGLDDGEICDPLNVPVVYTFPAASRAMSRRLNAARLRAQIRFRFGSSLTTNVPAICSLPFAGRLRVPGPGSKSFLIFLVSVP
jgi:hypothetical protein